MYLVVVYDVGEGRTSKPRKLLRSHLQHVQNSVFEGEVTEANAQKIKSALKEVAQSGDSIIIYEMWSESYVDRTTHGDDPMDESNFI